MAYLLDANVFIQAKNEYYGFDIVPAFWDWLIQSNTNGTVFSIEKVGAELCDYADELADWAKARIQAGGFFLPPDEPVLAALRDLADWANAQPFTQAAVNEFLRSADYYLVAHALAHQFVVVTQERFEPAATRRVKIPNACNAFGVQSTNTYDMLRVEGAKFV